MKNTIIHKLLTTLLVTRRTFKGFLEAENRKYQEKELEKEERLNEVGKQLTEQSKTISRQSEQIEKQTQLLEKINNKLPEQEKEEINESKKISMWLLVLIDTLAFIGVLLLLFLIFFKPTISAFEIIALLVSLVSITFYEVKYGEGNDRMYVRAPLLKWIIKTQTDLYQIALVLIAPLVIASFTPDYIYFVPEHMQNVPFLEHLNFIQLPAIAKIFYVVEFIKRILVFGLTCVIIILFINKILEINFIKKQD